MNKITYSSLKLKTKEDIKEIQFNEYKIEIKQYLSISDKIDLVDITLQKAKEDKLYNPLKVNMYFHLHLIYLYTNLTFTDKQKEDEEKLYDVMESNGLIDMVVAAIPEHEYNELLNMTNEKIENELKYSTTAAGMVSNLLKELPIEAEKMTEIMNNFDLTKYQNILDFVKASNGGRPIK